MAGIDTELRMREMAAGGNPQAAQQRYAQSKSLMDLLVAQRDQLDMSNAQVTKNDMMRSVMPGVQMKAARDSQAMQRQAMGVPSQPAPNIRMRDGGIVGYSSRGSVDSLAAALEAEGITDPVAVELIRSIYGQESSSGRNTGPSPAGARGPMQVMPATFVEMMGPDADIDDPMTNLRAGSRYAQQMLRRAGGDPRLAAAGYYGGPGGMNKLRAGKDTQAPQAGFPSVSEYADEVVGRMDEGNQKTVGRNSDYTGDLEAAGIDPDFYESTFREDAGQGARPPSPSVVQVPGVGTVTIPSAKAREIGRTPRETVGKSGEELFLDSRFGEAFVSPRDREARLEELRKNRAFRSGVPLGDQVPSRDAGRKQVADPLNVKDMVGRLGSPEFRTQGIMRDAEPTDRQRFAKALGLPLKDFEKKAPPPEKKGIFDNVDIGRLQAFLAGGAGQTSTAGALGGGLRGLMAEDQRRQTLASDEAIEASKIAAERYGAQLDYDAALAGMDADLQEVVARAELNAIQSFDEDKRQLARESLADIRGGLDEQFNKDVLLLRDQYKNDPEGLARELNAATNQALKRRVRIATEAGGGATGTFSTNIEDVAE
jgi:soluble lytic murein transglycosylase-like protein